MSIDLEERKKQLQELRAMPLAQKVQTTVAKILEFYTRTNKKCYVSCSGGADSMVLHDICDRMYQNGIIPTPIKVVFDDTGLEEPTVRATALSIDGVTVVKPQMSFYEVLKNIGYPIISKEVAECVVQARNNLENNNRERDIYRLEKLLGTAKQKDGSKSNYNKEKYKPLLNAPFRISNECCNIMKKTPLKYLEEYPIVGTMTEESILRENSWYKTGCNSFDKKIMSRPLSFWTKQDTLQYIKEKNLKIAQCYGNVVEVDSNNNEVIKGCGTKLRFSGVQRTGCIFCGFGMHLDTLKGGTSRFELLRQTQPKLFDYCMRGGKFDEQGLWIPHNGLGMAFVIEWLNRNLSKTLKSGKKSLFIKGIDLSEYKTQVDNAFEELERIEDTRKKWLKES